ncbi:hypothetical protein ABG067_005540 [Albugo candida]|uniref:PDZ domain-containing protein n=1 Tax=Albugo candida TaxID=65357 RepID=A0A024GFW7_9STRA|nr:unnamed protein product [Albugo candida]|eukprot:CCI45771.1 unnamed protein product [Albugo candida]
MWVPKRFLLLFKSKRKRKPSNVTTSAIKPIQKSRESSARLSRSSHQPPVVEIVWNGVSHLGFTLKRRRNGEVLVGRIKDASVPLSVGNVLISIGGISVQRLSRKELKSLMIHMSKPLLLVFSTNQGTERRERMSTRVHEETRALDSFYGDFMRESMPMILMTARRISEELGFTMAKVMDIGRFINQYAKARYLCVEES